VPPRAATPLWLAAALFLLSGAGALIVETTWLRWLRLVLGGGAPAVSATLVAFMSGQALGAALAARGVARARRPLLAYGVVELVAAAASLAVPAGLAAGRALLDPVTDALRDAPAVLTAARYATALAATLPAAVCFGASLPLLARAAVPAAEGLGRGGALLYGTNTVGAAVGTALATFVLPDRLGVSAGHAVGAGLLVLAGATAWTLGRREAPRAPGPRRRTPRVPPAARLRTLAALSGGASFAAQVLLVQAFARVLNQSTYAFGMVLIVTLVALAVGALAVAALERSGRVPAASALGWSLALAALAFAAFPAVFVGATDGLAYLGTEHPWPDYLWRSFDLAARCAGPALLAAAGVFPALLALAGHGARPEDGAEPGALAGSLLAWNTAGALVGALLAPYVLLPTLGLWLALTGVGLVYAVAAVFLAPAPPGGSRLVRDVALGLGWMLVISRGSPLSLAPIRVEDGARLLAAEQTPAGLVAVLERDDGRRLQIDNHYSLGGGAGAVRQERQGHLPLLLHPAPERVAFLGSATGISAGAALLHPSVSKLTLVEIVPGVARAASRFFAVENRGAYDRGEVVLDDARNYVRSTKAQFDVIVADLFVPWRAGTGALYAREHFEAGRARLAPGGLFCQWLPLYQLSREEVLVIAATFFDVFPDAYALRGDFFARHPILALVGGAGPLPDPERIAERAASLAAAGVDDRWVSHPLGPLSLYLAPLAPAAAGWHAVPRNSDDRPRIEFLAARTHAGARGKQVALVGLDYAGLAKAWREAAASAGALDALREDARRAGDGGHALQVAGALFTVGRRAEAGRALATAAELLPAALLADAPPDPTAAEAWRDEGP
jgi:spermidine synthase